MISLKHGTKSYPPIGPNSFLPEIESLRGIAAMAVLLGHFYLFLNLPAFFAYFLPNLYQFAIVKKLIAGIFDPQPAVLLFFTISGLVLGRLLRKEKIIDTSSFLAYLCRRIFRLIPLMWATTLIAFLLSSFRTNVNLDLLYSTFLLKNIGINVPLWSLQVELLCSLFFPILFLIFEYSGVIYNLILFFALSLISFFWQDPIFIQFLVFFHAGLIIDTISPRLTKVTSGYKGSLLLFVSVVIFLLAPQFSIGPRNWAYGHWQAWVLPEIAACSLIVLCVINHSNKWVNNFLGFTIIKYLGKISFSIYLIHFPILQLMRAKFPPPSSAFMIGLFFFSFLALVMVLASATYYWLEIPSNKLGKILSKYILSTKKAVVLTETTDSTL